MARIAGKVNAHRYVFTSEFIPAKRAYELGVVSEVFPTADLHNKVIDIYRSRNRRPEISLDEGSQADDETASEFADTAAPSQERKLGLSRAVKQLYDALSQLPDNQREAFLMQEEGGMTLEEIADVTGVGRETVKSRLRYATAKLRAAVNWAGGEQ